MGRDARAGLRTPRGACVRARPQRRDVKGHRGGDFRGRRAAQLLHNLLATATAADPWVLGSNSKDVQRIFFDVT